MSNAAAILPPPTATLLRAKITQQITTTMINGNRSKLQAFHSKLQATVIKPLADLMRRTSGRSHCLAHIHGCRA